MVAMMVLMVNIYVPFRFTSDVFPSNSLEDPLKSCID